MRWILIIFCISLPLAAIAQKNRLLQCLGAEEKRLHQAKDTGPFYDLNQKVIGELIQIPQAEVSNEDFKYICGSPEPSESWKVLKLSIQKGKSLFIPAAGVTGIQKQIAEGMVEDYLESTKGILINFINQIQALSPTPNCLLEEIPKLGEFFRDIKYLEEDVDMKIIFKNRDEEIFLQLKKYPEAFQRCRDRLKKKPRSESTTEAR
jgi:hypothetical protein